MDYIGAGIMMACQPEQRNVTGAVVARKKNL